MEVQLHQNISYKLNLSLRKEPVFQDICPGLQAQNAVLIVTLLVGTASNVWLMMLIVNHRKRRWTPDKILIINLAVVDLLGCLTSLPLHLIFLNTKLSSWSSAVCLARFHTMFTYFAVNVMTVAGISVDRYDAICCIPHRKMTSLKAFLIVVFVWVFAFCSTLAGGSIFLVTHLESWNSCTYYGKIIPTRERTGRSIMIAVVAIWIIPSIGIMINRFIGIMRCVRGHFQHIRQILRNTKMRREISLTKTCVSFAVTYLVLWGGFAICVVIRNQLTSLEAHCAFLWSYTLAYLSFTAVSIEYIIMDKRFWKKRRIRVGNRNLTNNSASFSQRGDHEENPTRSQKGCGNGFD